VADRRIQFLAAIVVLCVGCSRPEISVVSATYGANCGAPAGNATAPVRAACDGQSACTYRIDVRELGDPATGCPKNFAVTFRCSGEEPIRTTGVQPEAGLGTLLSLGCRGTAPPRLDILAVVKDGAVVADLARDTARLCAGRTSCQIPEARQVSGPAALRAPIAQISWRCEGSMIVHQTQVLTGTPTTLSCE
jgi:hypothetical protein